MKLFSATILATLLAILVSSILVASASALPSTYQRFDVKVTGKAGTNSKPRAVKLFMMPYHLIGDSGGKTNEGGVNSGALLETPFATVYANVWLPKEISFNTKSFPACSEVMALGDPDSCPKGSEIGGGKAHGYVRPTTDAPGFYALAVDLTNRVFVDKDKKNAIILRVYSPLSGNAILIGQLSKATGKEAKTFGNRLRFTLPKGLIQPFAGLMSQLSSFDATLPAQVSKGKPFAGLGKCPASRKMNFGYNGEYNIGGDTTTSGKPVNADGFVINEIGPIIKQTVACK